MKINAKRILSVVLALATSASLTATAFAADYAHAPEFPTAPSISTAAPATNISNAVDDAIDSAASNEDGQKIATVEVKSTSSIVVGTSVIKKLKKNDVTLTIVSPKVTITIDPSTITKVKKLDLSMKVSNTSSKTSVTMKSKKDLGCELNIAVTSCKMSEEKLANADVSSDNGNDASMEVVDGVPVITVTKGGTYVIK